MNLQKALNKKVYIVELRTYVGTLIDYDKNIFQLMIKRDGYEMQYNISRKYGKIVKVENAKGGKK